MPTESSVVASLIRDANTHRLPSEPGIVDLFKPPPGEQPSASRAPRPVNAAPSVPTPSAQPAVPQRAARQHAIAQHAAAKTKSPQPAKARSLQASRSQAAWIGWLQFVLATAALGAWGYFAAQFDPYGESSPRAAVPQATTVTPISTMPPPSISVTPIAPPVPAQTTTETAIASPSDAVHPAAPSGAQPSAPPAAAPVPTLDTQPAVVEMPAPATTAPLKKKQRRHAASKATAKAKAKASVAKKTTASGAPQKSAVEAPPPAKPAAAMPAEPAAVPRKPMQHDDSENPLK